MDGKECILVLEDDVTFHPHAAEMLELFFKQVPGDWDQVFLGGEHFHPPEWIKHRPFVLRGRGVHRTHAFGMKRQILPAVYQHIANYPDYMKGGEWHVDHQLGAAHLAGLWKTYTPSWWIAGQIGGRSNIAEKNNPDYWWHLEDYSTKLPFVQADSGRDYPSEVISKLHFGNHLAQGTFQDSGLEKCLDDDSELRAWLELIAREAIKMGLLPGICHPGIDLERLRNQWSGPVYHIDTVNLDEMIDYPHNGLFPHFLNQGKRLKAQSPRLLERT
jgi:hypothetical protein